MKILITGGSGFIGTNLIDHLLEKQIKFLNLDIKPPQKSIHHPHWQQVDILNVEILKDAFKNFRPTHVIHLAAKTDTDSNELSDYVANTDGTSNVLDAIKEVQDITHVIITSTQFVHRPGPLPVHDEDFDPHTTYGASKVISEQLTRKANLSCFWTIIRPTNVWGPWHLRYPQEFWRVLKKGLYFHPGGKKVIRCYAYVGNVVYQIMKILEMPPETVNKKVFYVGDAPGYLLDWVNGFSFGITGKSVRIVPDIFIRLLGYIGDALSLVKIKFPITSSRYKSMTQDYLTPMDYTFKTLGLPPYTMDQGIEITVKWLENDYQKKH